MINNYNLVSFSEGLYYGIVGDVLDWSKDFINKLRVRDFRSDHERARIWGEQSSRNWEKTLTNAEAKAIKDYTDRSWDLNNYLWNRKLDPTKEKNQDFEMQAKYLDQALAKIKTKETLIVYRRVHLIQFYPTEEKEKEAYEKLLGRDKYEVFDREVGDYIFDNFIKKQATYQEHSFVSTSLSQDPEGLPIAFRDRRVLLKIRVPKGTNAAFLPNTKVIEHYKNQNEILISKDCRFQYKNACYTKINGYEVLKIDVDLLKNN